MGGPVGFDTRSGKDTIAETQGTDGAGHSSGGGLAPVEDGAREHPPLGEHKTAVIGRLRDPVDQFGHGGIE